VISLNCHLFIELQLACPRDTWNPPPHLLYDFFSLNFERVLLKMLGYPYLIIHLALASASVIKSGRDFYPEGEWKVEEVQDQPAEEYWYTSQEKYWLEDEDEAEGQTHRKKRFINPFKYFGSIFDEKYDMTR